MTQMLSALVTVAVVLLTAGAAARHENPSAAQTGTQVVLLGTGTPPADPDRSGPATAVVVKRVLREMSPYAGRVVVGRDLDVY